MVSVLEVADKIYQIDPGKLKKGIPCIGYLVVDEQIALIETGSSSQVPEILAGMARLGFDKTSLSYIIPTHIHVDHGGGTGYLARQAPQAQVVLHKKGARHLIDPSKLVDVSRQTFGEDFQKAFGPVLPVPESKVIVVEGGECISLGQRELRIIHTPGHAPHHICIYETLSEGLFCGEALGCYFPADDTLILAIAPPIFELDLALDSIERMRNLGPKTLFFSQWGVSQEAHRLIDLTEDYTKTCGDIILEAMRAGETEENITQRVRPYIANSAFVQSESLQRTLNSFIAAPYMAYFKREGLA